MRRPHGRRRTDHTDRGAPGSGVIVDSASPRVVEIWLLARPPTPSCSANFHTRRASPASCSALNERPTGDSPPARIVRRARRTFPARHPRPTPSMRVPLPGSWCCRGVARATPWPKAEYRYTLSGGRRHPASFWNSLPRTSGLRATAVLCTFPPHPPPPSSSPQTPGSVRKMSHLPSRIRRIHNEEAT